MPVAPLPIRRIPVPATFMLLAALACGTSSTPAAPTITGFTPTSGPVATVVTVTGSGFGNGVNSVTLGGVAVPSATGLILSDTQLSFPVPAAAVTGPVSLVSTSGTATSALEFIVAPVITGLAPGTAPAGTPVTITGSGLMGITQISFGSTIASPTVHTANQIVVPVPAGAATGAVTVTLQVDPSYGLANLLAQFTVTQ